VEHRHLRSLHRETRPADVFSGLFINQLPGINLKVIEGSADGDQGGYLALWDDVEKRGLLKFALAVKAQLNKCFNLTDSTVVACLVCENKKLFSLALWYFLGVELLIEITATERLNRYTTIDTDKAERLKAEFFTEFQAALQDGVSSLKPSESTCVENCLEESTPVQFVSQLP
jgi:hypothetical protein